MLKKHRRGNKLCVPQKREVKVIKNTKFLQKRGI